MSRSLTMKKTLICLSTALFGSLVYANTFEQEISSLAIQQWQIIQQQKSIPSKLSAQLLSLSSEGIPKSINPYKSAVLAINQVSVSFIAQPGQGAALEQLLSDHGMNIQSRIGNVIFATTAPSQLTKVSSSELLLSADIQGVMQGSNTDQLISQLNQFIDSNTNTSKSVQDEGVQATHAYLLHQHGFQGQGIKVGIIDFGYAHYQTLRAKNLVPDPKKTMAFIQGRRQNQLTTTGAKTTVHGTATTEVIYSMAPKAEFYIAQVGDGDGSASDGDVAQAMKWLAEQKVNIINFSGGGHFRSHDGTSPLDKQVQQMFDAGILWVNAAGNEGAKHWLGKIQDKNNNQLIDISPQGDFLVIEKKQSGYLQIVINWDDWADSKQGAKYIDVNAMLLSRSASGQVITVDIAKDSRSLGASAIEVISTQVPAGIYYLALTADKYIPKNIHVFVEGANLPQNIASGSIGIPATAEASLSVAAWDVRTKNIAVYSSHGYTDDGRVKPDISAPTNVMNTGYQIAQNRRYEGTSAASPYAAGFAAAYWSKYPSLSNTELKKRLIQQTTTTISKQSPSQFAGYGLLDARKISFTPTPTPTPTPAPQPPSVTSPPNTDVPTRNSETDDALRLIRQIGGM